MLGKLALVLSLYELRLECRARLCDSLVVLSQLTEDLK